VGCLVTSGKKILLCKRAIQPQYGLWNLPAGFMENHERAEEGAMRETLEESNARVRIVKLHALYSLPAVNQVYLHFLARLNLLESEIHPTKESLEVRFFDRADIPWDEIAFQSTTFALEKYFEAGDDFTGVHIGSFSKKGKW
jgi:ADP-ribose pyrophosphatase YjhB (NUDIX family)